MYPLLRATRTLLLDPGTDRAAILRVRVDLPERVDWMTADPTGCDPDLHEVRMSARTFYGHLVELAVDVAVVADEARRPWLTTVPISSVSLDLAHRAVAAHVITCLATLDEISLPSVGAPSWKPYFCDGDFSGCFAGGWMIEGVLYTPRESKDVPVCVRRQIVVPELAPFFPRTVDSPGDRDLRGLHAVASARS